MRWLVTFVGFNVLLFVVVLGTLWDFGGFENSGLTGHGWIALSLGVVFTSALGVALMALVFYSARKDYDESAYRAGRLDRPER
jgi:hypothetical protein